MGFTGGGHVSCEDGHNPADFGNRASLEKEKTADELLIVAQQGWVGGGGHILQRCEDLVEFAGAGCFGRVAVGHVPARKEFVDVQLLGGRDGASVGVACVLCAKIPARGAFVVKADAFVAVGSERLSKGIAVGEDEIVVDVRDNDQDGRVVEAVNVQSVSDGERLQVLSKSVEVDCRACAFGFGVVDVFDVDATVRDEAGEAVVVAQSAPELVPGARAVYHAVEAAVE